MSFASKYISLKFVEMWWDKSVNQMKLFLVSNIDNSDVASFWRQVFKAHGHKLLRSGDNFTSELLTQLNTNFVTS